MVAYDPKKDRNPNSEFSKIATSADTHLLVRARIKEDLDWLKPFLPTLHIETDKSADYSFRCVIPRKVLKKALAQSVDDIDYDSHFKEVAEDRSPKVNGRHSAMMGCWSKMAELQPYSPYGGFVSGSYTGGTGWYSTGTKSGASSGATSTTTSTPKALSAKAPGAKDMTTYWLSFVESDGSLSFRDGNGPRSGFKVNDRVNGYFGSGVVKAVAPGKGNAADTITVLTDDDKTKKFVSNFVEPAEVPAWVKEELESAVFASEADSEEFDLDYMFEWLKKNPTEDQIQAAPRELLAESTNDAFELITRVQERMQAFGHATLPQTLLNEVYDEILWETSTDAQRKSIFGDGVVPPKYEADAAALFSQEEIEKDEDHGTFVVTVPATKVSQN